MLGRNRIATLVLATLIGPGLAAGTAAAKTTLTTDVSTNWAGYAVTGGATTSFASVSGSWVVPKATCTAGSTADAAFWVGLGGYDDNAQGLEQVGTESRCNAAGTTTYTVWYEILPAAAVSTKLAVRAGDTVTSSVTVTGHTVTVRVTDLTRKTSFVKTLAASSIDVSSAEWIAEAPSVCDGRGFCRTVALANFGKVTFTKAAATAGGHTGAIGDRAWTATAIELRSSGGPGPFAAYTASADAVPGSLSSDGSSFSVTWRQSTASQPLRP